MPGYKFISINDPLARSTAAYGLNDLGQIVGSYDDGSGSQGFLFDGASFSTLNDPQALTLPPFHTTVASGINASGQIVGRAGLPEHGFLDNGGTFTDFSNSARTLPEGINNSGEIVGYSVSPIFHLAGGNVSGFLYVNGSFTPINDPNATQSAQGSGTFARGINDSGQIAGYFNASSDGSIHGFLYSGGSFITLDDPLAVQGTFATGINNAGQIVGYYYDASRLAHGFLYSGGSFTTLDDRHGLNGTFPSEINNLGQIAGYYLDSNNVQHGFLGETPSPFDNPTWGLVAVGDFNGDDKADLAFVRSADNLPEIQFQNGQFPAGGGLILNSPFDSSWQVITGADFNGDGKTDLVYQRASDGLTELQFLNGLTGVGGGLILNSPFDTSWRIAAAGDFNDDGKSDLVWQRASDGLVEIQLLNGTTGVGGGIITNSPFGPDWKPVGAGDFNGDGTSDLVWQRASDGLVELQFLNGNAAIGGGTIANNPFGAGWNIAGIGDFNGDGRSDLVWNRPSDGLTEIQFLNGLTPIGGGAIADTQFDPSWHVAGIGDFNGDGFSDLLWQHAGDGLTETQLLHGTALIG